MQEESVGSVAESDIENSPVSANFWSETYGRGWGGGWKMEMEACSYIPMYAMSYIHSFYHPRHHTLRTSNILEDRSDYQPDTYRYGAPALHRLCGEFDSGFCFNVTASSSTTVLFWWRICVEWSFQYNHIIITSSEINSIIQFNSIQFNSLLFMCRVNSHKANYRHSTVQTYITT
jgi:hypothetical protein